MLRIMTPLILIVVVMVSIQGCASPEEEIPVDTAFGRMLSMVPYSFLEEQDIWYNDHEKVFELHGIEGIPNMEDAMKLPEEEIEPIREASEDLIGPIWRVQNIRPIAGFDGTMIKSSAFIDIIPPRSFSITEGEFDKDLIAGKLTEQGYETTTHGDVTYFTTKEEGISFANELSRLVPGLMNHLAVLDDVLVIAPHTERMTAILDTIAGDEPSVRGNAACRAVAESLGDVIAAQITTPDRVTTPDSRARGIPPYDFDIPDDWGILHQWEMAALGYQNNGTERYWIISLYYADNDAARADGAELVKRMKGYLFNTQLPQAENVPLTERFEVGEPIIRKYPDGATLTVINRFYAETGGIYMLMSGAGIRDILFLAPDPSLYIGKPENTVIIREIPIP